MLLCDWFSAQLGQGRPSHVASNREALGGALDVENLSPHCEDTPDCGLSLCPALQAGW